MKITAHGSNLVQTQNAFEPMCLKHWRLAKAARRVKKYADKGRRSLKVNIGDKVMLKLTPQIWKKISNKSVYRGLIPRYDSPFVVIKRVGNGAYRLKLPDRLKIHLIFMSVFSNHITKIWLTQQDNKRSMLCR